MAIYLHGQRIPFMVMGNGSNLLVSGGGVRGVVINLEYGLKNVRMLGEIVIADAGVVIIAAAPGVNVISFPLVVPSLFTPTNLK